MRTIGSCGQLAAGGKTVGHETLKKHRLEVGSSQVDGGGMSCRSRADDNLEKKGLKTVRKSDGRGDLRLWSASLNSSRFFR